MAAGCRFPLSMIRPQERLSTRSSKSFAARVFMEVALLNSRVHSAAHAPVLWHSCDPLMIAKTFHRDWAKCAVQQLQSVGRVFSFLCRERSTTSKSQSHSQWPPSRRASPQWSPPAWRSALGAAGRQTTKLSRLEKRYPGSCSLSPCSAELAESCCRTNTCHVAVPRLALDLSLNCGLKSPFSL